MEPNIKLQIANIPPTKVEARPQCWETLLYCTKTKTVWCFKMAGLVECNIVTHILLFRWDFQLKGTQAAYIRALMMAKRDTAE